MLAFRRWMPVAFLIALAPPVSAQLPKEPAAVFSMAAPFYDFTSADLKPWHLKAAYQLYDDKGEPTEQGTYEYWWASPTVYRSSWTRGKNVYTDWHTSDGHRWERTGDGLDYFEYGLQSRLLSPLPDAEERDPRENYFDQRTVKLGETRMPCIMIVPNMPSHVDVPMGLFPTYCFDPGRPILRTSSSFGAVSVVYNRIARVQNRFLAEDITEYEGAHKILSSEVNTVEGLRPDDPALTPPPDAKTDKVGAVVVGSSIMQGNRIGGPMPVYPQDAKDSRAEGMVVLKAVIGRDGRIHNLKVAAAPWPSLVASAMVAVSQWTYKPYLLNGEPVDVVTQINVIYKLGR